MKIQSNSFLRYIVTMDVASMISYSDVTIHASGKVWISSFLLLPIRNCRKIRTMLSVEVRLLLEFLKKC